MTDNDVRAAELRRALADNLQQSGNLRSPRWRQAVEQVPRHLFVPAFFRWTDGPGGITLWAPVSKDQDPEQWLELAYRDETLVTQLDRTLVSPTDRHVTPHDVAEPVQGDPTSSSTLPGLVVRMLEDLDVEDGMTVLEIGTGTGYSSALMSERLGDGQVTSIEFDPGIAANAAAALKLAGHAPHLVVGDGLDGVPERAPYDRLVATCSVRHIPRAWLDQTRPGGRILVTLAGWLNAYGLALLEMRDDGIAEGRFLPGTISFMIARPQAPEPITSEQRSAAFEMLADATPRPTAVGHDVREDWTSNFVAQLAIPNARQETISRDGGPFVHYYFDTATESVASLTAEPDGGWTVRQAGPVRLWDAVETAVGLWREAGSPPQEQFRIRTDGRTQTVWVDGPNGPISWDLTV
jgi:methyltransferase of ATP-grasp peptide maturase system